MKLFTMDMVDQQKVEEYVYEMALQASAAALYCKFHADELRAASSPAVGALPAAT